jgi:hypothetical protein
VLVGGQSLGLGGLSGSSASNVWATAGTSIYHYDGTQWSLWAGYSGTAQLKGGTWTIAPGDAWAFGQGGTALHFNGTGWSVASAPFSSWVDAAGGSGSTLWASEFGGHLWRFSGGTWTDEGISARRIWQASPSLRLTAAFSASGWDEGLLYRDTGGGWSLLTNTIVTGDLQAIWVVSAGDAWIGSSGGDLLHWDGAQWTKNTTVGAGVTSIWGSAPNDVWAVGGNVLAHWNGSSWSTQSYVPSSGVMSFRAVWGFAKSDVWAVGDKPDVLHYDGASWTKYPNAFAAQSFTGLWGTASTDLWAFTGTLTAWHNSGTGFAAVTTAGVGVKAGWGAASNDVWGTAGVHWDGTMWSQAITTAVGQIAFWGSSATDVWAVGGLGSFPDHGSTAHWDGVAWCERDIPITEDVAPGYNVRFTSENVLAVGGSSASDVWAVGKRGLILHSP